MCCCWGNLNSFLILMCANFSFLLFFSLPKNYAYNFPQFPGLIIEPLIFVIIAYWLAGLRSTLAAFSITSLASILILNVSTACGCFFSAAFSSVPLAMAYLVPFDYILMTTSGVFISLYTLPKYLAWMPFFNWLMYGNELMSIAQWSGVTNISKIKRRVINFNFDTHLMSHFLPLTPSLFFFHLLIPSAAFVLRCDGWRKKKLALLLTSQQSRAIRPERRFCSISTSRRVISTLISLRCFCSMFSFICSVTFSSIGGRG